jgi:hypothetical protein
MSRPLDMITDSELVFAVSSRANTNSEFGSDTVDGSVDPQHVTQICVAPFVEGTGKTNSRLDCCDRSRPGNDIVCSKRAEVFKLWRSGIKRQGAFDINLRNAAASDRSRDTWRPVGRMSQDEKITTSASYQTPTFPGFPTLFAIARDRLPKREPGLSLHRPGHGSTSPQRQRPQAGRINGGGSAIGAAPLFRWDEKAVS